MGKITLDNAVICPACKVVYVKNKYGCPDCHNHPGISVKSLYEMRQKIEMSIELKEFLEYFDKELPNIL